MNEIYKGEIRNRMHFTQLVLF